MLMLKPLLWKSSCLIALGLLGAACSEAKFTGSPPARGRAETPATGVACAVEPGRVGVGQKASIKVAITTLGAAGAPAELRQRVVGAAADPADVALTLETATGTYARADGAANEIASTAAGTLKVELRASDAGDAPVAGCELLVEAAPPPPPPPPPPPCQDTERSVGAAIAFLVDNSKSNEATDCPSSYRDGERDGLKRYSCGSQTNRETAVLAAFDALQRVADAEPDNALARSSMAVASFPTETDGLDGYATRLDWLDVAAGERQRVASGLTFTRKPWGHTPYDAAMSAASNLFQGQAAGERARVAVLVTDGEATDRDPAAVVRQAEALRQSGVTVFTVFYNGGVSADQRAAKHRAMLAQFDAASRRATGRPWYDAAYASLDAYVADILGGAGAPSLIQKVSSDRKVVEVADATKLAAAFQAIVRTVVQCQAP